MNRTIAALVTGILAIGAFAAPVAAETIETGDCLQAYVIMYDGANQSGNSALMCWNFADFNIEGEPGAVIGPLGAGGGYANDFDNIETQSGIGSIYFADFSGGVNAAVCFYDGKNLTGGLIAFRISTGLMQTTTLYRAGSFKFVNGNNC